MGILIHLERFDNFEVSIKTCSMLSILLSSERRKTKQFDIYEMNIEITFKLTASYVVVPKVERNWHFESTLFHAMPSKILLMNKVYAFFEDDMHMNHL